MLHAFGIKNSCHCNFSSIRTLLTPLRIVCPVIETHQKHGLHLTLGIPQDLTLIVQGSLSVDLGDGGASAVGSVFGGLSIASSVDRGRHQGRGQGHGRGHGREGEGGSSNGRRWEEPSTPLECIDLGDPIHRFVLHTI